MDYREATQIQSQTPRTTAAAAAAAAAEKLPVDALGRYMKAMETLRLGAARASREMLRAMLEVVDQDVADLESRHDGSMPLPRHTAPQVAGKRAPLSPSERFRGVPPIREGSAPPEIPPREVEK